MEGKSNSVKDNEQALTKASQAAPAIEKALVMGDLKDMTAEQRVMFYKAVCESVGLNPLTRPFEYITLNNRLTLYARKDATDQLRKLHNVGVEILSREVMDDVYIVKARALMANGRMDEAIGSVSIAGLKGELKANAIMKAETKAKRRVTLSICGLGILDETEAEPQARRGPWRFASPEPMVQLEAGNPGADPDPLPEVSGVATGVAGEPQRGLGAPPTPENLTLDEVRDIETACQDAGAKVGDLLAWIVTKLPEVRTLADVPREKLPSLNQWIAKRKTA